jgi:hypothetical protein
LANITRPPFYAPRPPDDNNILWVGTPQGSWLLRELSQQVFFGKGGQVPTKDWSQWLTYDDSAVWSGSPLGIPTVLRPTNKPFVPVFWNYNYDDPAVWSTFLTPDYTTNFALLLGKPFVPHLWNFNYDDSSYWVGQPRSNPLITPLLTNAGQAPTKEWSQWQTYDDSAYWVGAPITPNYNVSPPAPPPPPPGITLSGVVVQPPFYSPNPPIDDPLTLKSIANPALLQLTKQQNPFIPVFYQFGDDAAVWQGQPTTNQTLLHSSKPFVPQFWANNYDDTAIWVGKPVANNTINLLTAGGVVKPKQWLFGYDDAAVWSGQPIGIPDVQRTQINPIVPLSWSDYYRYNEDAVAPGQSLGSNTMRLLAAKPFVPTFWNYNTDDSSVWSGAPSAIPQSLYAQKPFTPPVWRYNYDDAALWVGQSIASNIETIHTHNNPVIPGIWSFNYDDQSLWSGAPIKSALLADLLTAGGQPPTKKWSQWQTYDDPAFWVGQPSGVPSILQYSLKPFIPVFAQYYDDPAFWQGQPIPINANIFTPTAFSLTLTSGAYTIAGSNMSLIYVPLAPVVQPITIVIQETLGAMGGRVDADYEKRHGEKQRRLGLASGDYGIAGSGMELTKGGFDHFQIDNDFLMMN